MESTWHRPPMEPVQTTQQAQQAEQARVAEAAESSSSDEEEDVRTRESASKTKSLFRKNSGASNAACAARAWANLARPSSDDE